MFSERPRKRGRNLFDFAGYAKYLGAHKGSPAFFMFVFEVFVCVPASSVSSRTEKYIK